MATHKSAAKRARQAIKRNERNSATLGSVRTIEKKLRAALASNDKAKAQEILSGYISKISKASTKGVVHLKTASRKIARLSQRVSQLASK